MTRTAKGPCPCGGPTAYVGTWRPRVLAAALSPSAVGLEERPAVGPANWATGCPEVRQQHEHEATHIHSSRGFLPGSPLRSPALWLVYWRGGVTASQPTAPRARVPLPRQVGPSARSDTSPEGGPGRASAAPTWALPEGAVAAHGLLRHPATSRGDTPKCRADGVTNTQADRKRKRAQQLKPARRSGRRPRQNPPPERKLRTGVLCSLAAHHVTPAAARDLASAPPSSPSRMTIQAKCLQLPFLPEI